MDATLKFFYKNTNFKKLSVMFLKQMHFWIYF